MTSTAARPSVGSPAGPHPTEDAAPPTFVERLLKPARPLRLTPTQAGALAAGIGVFTLFVGIVLGPSVALLFLAALVGSAVAVVALVVPWVALGLMVMLEFANVSGVFEQRSPVSIYTATLALGILSAGIALARPQYRARIRTRWWLPVALYVVYLVSQVPATVLSVAPEASANSLDNSLKDGLFLAVLLLLMQLANRPWMVGAAIVLAMAPIAGLTAINQYVLDNNAMDFWSLLSQAWVDTESIIPNVGASGAVAGVLGAYLVWFGRERVTSVIPIFPIIYPLPSFSSLL